jgi:hypothetical protein
MIHSDYRTLVDRGRKAGLRTSELYSAISARPLELSDPAGEADGNGFVSGINQNGQRVFRPAGYYPRS